MRIVLRMTRWATFDCYGTLIDWNGGIRAELARLWPDEDADALLEAAQLDPAQPESDPAAPAASAEPEFKPSVVKT